MSIRYAAVILFGFVSACDTSEVEENPTMVEGADVSQIVVVSSPKPAEPREVRLVVAGPIENPVLSGAREPTAEQVSEITLHGDLRCWLNANSERTAPVVGEYLFVNLGDEEVDYALRTTTDLRKFPTQVSFKDQSGRLKVGVSYDSGQSITEQNASHDRYGPPYFDFTLDGEPLPNGSSMPWSYRYPYFECEPNITIAED